MKKHTRRNMLLAMPWWRVRPCGLLEWVWCGILEAAARTCRCQPKISNIPVARSENSSAHCHTRRKASLVESEARHSAGAMGLFHEALADQLQFLAWSRRLAPAASS